MRHLRSYVTSRVIATTAAVGLLGVGAAIAVEGPEGPEGAETPVEEGSATEVPEEEPSDDDPDDTPQLQEDDPEEDPEEDAEGEDDPVVLEAPEERAGDGERSETARQVHRALTGSDDLAPGDPGFGAAVSERARSGGLGHIVSRAARGEDLSADDLEVQPRERPGGGDDTEEGSRGGPPDHAPAHGRRR